MNIILLFAFTFLSVPVHGRVIYSGSAFSSYTGEPENLFWNPAGMGKEGYLTSTHNYSGVTYGCLGVVKKVGDYRFGVGLQSLYTGDMIKTNSTGGSEGEFSYYSIVPILSTSYRKGGFAIGGKLVIPYSRTDVYTGYGVGVDVGVIYRANKNFSFSFYGRNIGKQISGFVSEQEDFPFEARFGGLYQRNEINFALEYSFPFGVSTSLNYGFNESFELIMGYNGGLRELREGNGVDALSGLSLGFRTHYREIVIDIGAVSYGVLGISKTIAIGYRI